ncbi:MarR family transcriptional regulator [Myxococcota bacterium]|jgi:hypothetical protein|nr:MarR family transcriptional regulator [Myxococcota bacterium]
MKNNPAHQSHGEHAHRPAPDPLTRAVLQVAHAAGAFIEYWGFKAIHGRIWTLLALHKEPLPQSEIADLLGVSRSLVSTAIAELTEYGLVRAVDEHRNAPYEAVIDIWPTIADVLRSREWMLLEGARVALEAAIEEAEIAATAPVPGEPLRWDVDRLRMLLSLTEMAQGFLKMVIALRMPRAPDNLGGWLGRAQSLVARLRGGVGAVVAR